MFQDEVRKQLERLLDEIGAEFVEICSQTEDEMVRNDQRPRSTYPIDTQRYLSVGFAPTQQPENFEITIENGIKRLIACSHRWDESLPRLFVPQKDSDRRPRILERIRIYLDALCCSQFCTNAMVLVRGQLITSARPLSSATKQLVPTMLERLSDQIEQNRGNSSHAELITPNCYCRSFWFDAVILLLFSGTYAVDFVRHRTKLVTRELVALLPDLDDPPLDPASAQTLPDP